MPKKFVLSFHCHLHREIEQQHKFHTSIRKTPFCCCTPCYLSATTLDYNLLRFEEIPGLSHSSHANLPLFQAVYDYYEFCCRLHCHCFTKA